ncbi:MAG TPA: YceI family protein [Burkholderiaceae bacterium]|nr:YceI family protein [Burkholderiaceae bacterium]
MKRALVLTALLASFSAMAEPQNLIIDPVLTTPTFDVRHLAFTTQTGSFKQLAGMISLDAARHSGSVNLTVYMSSLDMGSPGWAAHLMSEGLFNVEKYPTMTYRSQNLVFDGDKVVGANGELTLVGVTKPVRIVVSDFHCGQNLAGHKTLCGGDVTATIKRSDFGLTRYLAEVSDDVKVRVPLEAFAD